MASNLPSELIALILGEVYYLKDKPPPEHIFLTRNPDRHTVAACSLVNSSWRAVAQPLLFHHITSNVSPAFARWIRTPHAINLGLLSSVKTVELRLDTTVGQNGFPNLPSCGVDDFHLLLNSLPNLYELEISLQGFSVASSFQPRQVFQSLRALRINECSVQSPVLYELLSIFPGIRFLTIAIEIAALPPPIPIPSLQLYELVIYRSLSPDITKWLLANSVGSLRVLETREFVGIHLPLVLRGHYDHLHSLRLIRLDRSSLAMIQACNNLQELVLVTIPGSTARRDLTLSKLPSSLQHLSLIRRGKDSGSLVKLADAIRSSSPQLKLISCDRSFQSDPEYDVLVELCLQRGIELQIGESRHWPVGVWCVVSVATRLLISV
ncbi:hypothetical protein VNI00_002483 [Paramarasmius palmivorus]|uniref:F-box domain-containing protein n=1 Tax=Paramarasmius palmivorus TaxID=297713 RepID=A0AAW0E000_9AGAR